MPSKGLICFLCSLSLSVAALAQKSPRVPVVPSSCAVTKPADRFIPPAPYPAKAPFGHFWFGTDKLWIALPVTGTWSGLPHYTPADPTYR